MVLRPYQRIRIIFLAVLVCSLFSVQVFAQPETDDSDPFAEEPSNIEAEAEAEPAQQEQSDSIDVASLLRPSTRQWFGLLGFGPAIAVSNAGTQIKFSQEVGYHLFGGSEGLAIGGVLQESVGSGVFGLTIAPKAWWDFQVTQYALYISPFAQMGYSLLTNGGTLHRFNFQFGVEGRAVLNDRWIAFWRPFAWNFDIGNPTLIRFDMIFGVGITFD